MADNSYGCPKHEEHERRLNELHEAVEEVRNKVNKLDKEDGIRDEHYNMITKQLISSNKELSDTMKAVAKTMVDMREEMAGTNAKMESFNRTRFAEFKQNKPGLDNKTLSRLLKELQESGIVKKVSDDESNSTRYYLTEKGVL